MIKNLYKRRFSLLLAVIMIIQMTVSPFSGSFVYASEATDGQSEQNDGYTVQDEEFDQSAVEMPEKKIDETDSKPMTANTENEEVACEEALDTCEEVTQEEIIPFTSTEYEEALGDANTFTVSINVLDYRGSSAEGIKIVLKNRPEGSVITEEEVRSKLEELLPDLKNTKYELNGLFLNSSGDREPFGFGIGEVEENIILYTRLTKIYHVQFQDDSTVVSETDIKENSSIADLQSFIVKTPLDTVKGGITYVFDKWVYSNGELYNPGKPVTEDTAIIATWKKYYIVKFMGGDDLRTYTKEVKVSINEIIDESSIPREGYDGFVNNSGKFDYWYIGNNQENRWNSNDPVRGNLNLRAKWIKNKYTVSFNFDTCIDSHFKIKNESDKIHTEENITHGTKMKVCDFPIPPVVDGYDMVGWYEDDRFESKLQDNAEVVIQNNSNYYAKWEKKKYNVKFLEKKEGRILNTQTVEYFEKASTVDVPTAEYGTFDTWCWCPEGNLEKEWSFDNPISSNTVVYAKWDLHKYTVTINRVNRPRIVSTDVLYGSDIEKPELPGDNINPGFLFDDAWIDNEGNVYMFDTPLHVTSDIELTEKWTKAYTVSFNSDRVTVSSTQVREGHVVPIDAIPFVNKEGYDFEGWINERTGDIWIFDGISADRVEYDVALSANWKIKYYTVSFDTVGGTDVHSQSVSYDHFAVSPNIIPEKTGYTFLGWQDKDGMPWIFTESTRKIKKNETIYANWKINKYIVSFNYGRDGLDPTYQNIEYGGYVDRSAADKTWGSDNEYIIDGWYKTSYYTSPWKFTEYAVDENTLGKEAFEKGILTLYAKWKLKQLKVAFIPNNGTVSSDILINYDSNVELPDELKSIHKVGYKFMGWYKKGEEQEYNFNNKVKNDLILEARWEYVTEPISITISSDGKGKVQRNPTGKIKYDSDVTVTFIPDNGYEVKEVYIDGIRKDLQDNRLIISNITESHTISVRFGEIPKLFYTISASSGSGHGTVSPSTISIEEGKNCRIYFYPEKDYKIDYIIIDGEKKSISINYFSFKSVSSNHFLVAYFKYNAPDPPTPPIPPSPSENCIVKFVVNGQEYKIEYVKSGSILQRPEDPHIKDQIFLGWYIGNRKWIFSDPVMTDLTLTASFLKETVSKDDVHSGMDSRMNISDPNDITMVKGQKYSFGAGQWSTANSSVISVGKSNGMATAKNASNVPVNITNSATVPAITYKIKVLAPQMSAKKLTLGVGSSEKITLQNSSGLNVAWQSSNTKIASVNDGLISTKSKGNVKIYAWANGMKYTCSVKVTDTNTAPTNFDNLTSFTMRPTQTLNLKNVSVGGSKPNSLDWRLSDEAGTKDENKTGWLAWDDGVCRVDVKGKLTAKACGTSVIIGRSGNTRVKTIRVSVATVPSKTETYINVGKNEKLTYYKVNNSKASWDATRLGEIVNLGDTKSTMGRVYGLAVGSSVVSCSYNGMNYKTTVHVENPVLTMGDNRLGKTGENQYVLNLRNGTRFMLDMPEVQQQIVWKSGNKNVAFVDELGIIEGRKPGNTVVSTKINGTTIKVKVYVTN